MKKIGIMNFPISAAIASLGHNDTLTIVDAGFPIPSTTERIDITLAPGVPSFLQTLEVILNELFVERAIVAEEILNYSPHVYKGIQELLLNTKIDMIKHTELKKKAETTRAVIRTAEFNPYSNIILVAGAWGFKL
jgi:D-ribose pyranase